MRRVRRRRRTENQKYFSCYLDTDIILKSLFTSVPQDSSARQTNLHARRHILKFDGDFIQVEYSKTHFLRNAQIRRKFHRALEYTHLSNSSTFLTFIHVPEEFPVIFFSSRFCQEAKQQRKTVLLPTISFYALLYGAVFPPCSSKSNSLHRNSRVRKSIQGKQNATMGERETESSPL